MTCIVNNMWNIIHKLSIIIAILILSVGGVWAQSTDAIDSLIAVADNAPDSLVAEYNNNVCWKLRNVAPEMAIQFGMRAIENAQQTDNKEQLVKGYAYTGVCHRNIDNFDEALEYYKLGIKYALEYGLDDQLGYGYINLGNLLIYQKKYREAEAELDKALPIAMKLQDSAILGYVYLNLGRTRLGHRDFDKAEEYFQMSIDVRTKCKKLNKQVNVPRKYMADCHAAAGLKQLALTEYMSILKNVDMIGDYDLLGELTYDIAKIYYDYKRYDSAYAYATRSLNYARWIGSKSALSEAFSIINNVCGQKKDYKMLVENRMKQIEFNDSLFRKQGEQKMNAIQYSVFSYQKKAEITKLNEEKKSRQYVTTIALSALAIVGIFLFFVLTNARKVRNLNKLLENQKHSLEKVNTEIVSSVTYARRIQQAALTPSGVISGIFPDSMVYYRPKEIVSGDWYCVEAFDGLKIVMEADCTGISVPGAMLSMMGMSMFKDIINAADGSVSPAKVLDDMRRHVKKLFSANKEQDGGMEATLFVMDCKSMTMTFAAAAQSALLIRGTETVVLKGDPMPVGRYIDEQPFSQQTVQLRDGDSIYMMNGGIRAITNPDGERFASRRLTDFLVECATMPMAEICTRLEAEIEEWRQSQTPDDDMTMLGFRVWAKDNDAKNIGTE